MRQSIHAWVFTVFLNALSLPYNSIPLSLSLSFSVLFFVHCFPFDQLWLSWFNFSRFSLTNALDTNKIPSNGGKLTVLHSHSTFHSVLSLCVCVGVRMAWMQQTHVPPTIDTSFNLLIGTIVVVLCLPIFILIFPSR